MNRKELGTTGVLIPEVGIGTWNYHAGSETLRKGLEAGALFIDTAESYGTEGVVGEALAGLRDGVLLATKVSPQNFRKAELKRSVDSSLRRLRIDAIDLLQLHEPNSSVPIEETIGAMTALVDAGKVRFLGVSNFSVSQLQEAQAASKKYRIVSNQVRYNIIDRTIEKDLLQYCQTNEITVIAYSPLARGLSRIRDCDPNSVVNRLARDLGRSEAQIVLNWCLCKEGVVVIPGGNSVEHILENCGASAWQLSPEQVSLLDANIQYRQKNWFDRLVRRHCPKTLQNIGLRLVNYLPRGLRRRIT
jgi:diketogulonate reductase-like aldo/keto reductase